MPELSWRHHALIQALLSRGPLIEDDFHVIFSGITGKDPGFFSRLVLLFAAGKIVGEEKRKFGSLSLDVAFSITQF